MKFERHLDCEAVDFLPLADGYEKLAFLLADRTLAFHAGYGRHHSVRIPRFGRSLAYQKETCEFFFFLIWLFLCPASHITTQRPAPDEHVGFENWGKVPNLYVPFSLAGQGDNVLLPCCPRRPCALRFGSLPFASLLACTARDVRLFSSRKLVAIYFLFVSSRPFFTFASVRSAQKSVAAFSFVRHAVMPCSCCAGDMLVGCGEGEIHRFNLDQGRFRTPITLPSSSSSQR